jgi:hypothetical protein
MASTISAGITTTTALSYSADTSGVLQLQTNGTTTAVTIDTSQNVGLGVTPNAWESGAKVLQISVAGSGGTAGNTGSLWARGDSLRTIVGGYFNGTNYVATASNGAAIFTVANGTFQWQSSASTTSGSSFSPLAVMTLDVSGNLLVGTTTQTGTFNVTYAGTTQPVSYNYASNTSFTNAIVRAAMAGTSSSAQLFLGQNNNTSAVFYVQGNGTINSTSTSITGISDIRFKENIRDLDDGLNVVMALKPRKFDWKEGKGANTKNARGFIAQEFEQVLPDLIGEWFEEAPEGEEPYKSVSPDLIPTLVKAIQELSAQVTTLQTQVTALKG